MTTPLKSLRSTLPSSSKLGKRLGRNITSAVARRGAGHCCHGSSSQRPSFTTVHSFCIRATSVAIKSHQAAEIGERGLPRASRGLGLAAATWQPSFRLFSSAPAALFGDTIIVTKRCAERLNELREAKSKPELRLRLTVEGGGCSGFQYKFALENGAAGENSTAVGEDEVDMEDEDSDDEDEADIDHKFERDGAVLVIDDTSLGFVKGSTVDFEEDMMRSAFAVLNNPVSESACGCGSSFAIKNFEKNPALD